MQPTNRQKHLWSIILAGGDGERLRPLVERWMGHPLPKQYCTFIGTRSMFQHTVDRADQIADPEKRVIVISRSHYSDAFSQLKTRRTGKLILQPANRQTAVGIYLALSYIHRQDPEATVVVYPSDHFVYPEDEFLKGVRNLIKTAYRMHYRVCLLGVSPDAFDTDYGWIQPGPCLGLVNGQPIHAVKAFLEKPAAPECQSAIRSGALWNTLILAARLQILWQMGWRWFPEMMILLERYRRVTGTPEEEAILESIYPQMPSLDFSKHLLQNIPTQISALELKGVIWSDWGRQERILATLQQIGKQPAFLQANPASA
jgi:mannose-1-phosphate guanylyltransferase